ncbi:hypothetical protein ASE90_11250 [Sphingomonas sp. Leaf67]|nr:hypothetical protein ASE90_11250 [Sphingomonas sp. Leaf67]
MGDERCDVIGINCIKRTNAVNRFLKNQISFAPTPNGTTSRLATLAHKKVAVANRQFVALLGRNTHLQQI